MAGGKLYIEPILADMTDHLDTTLDSLDTSIVEIKGIVDTVGDKLDSQIAELQNIVSAVGTSVVAVPVSSALGEVYYNKELPTVSATITHNTTTNWDIASFTSFANGTIKFNITVNAGSYGGANTVCTVQLINITDNTTQALWNWSKSQGGVGNHQVDAAVMSNKAYKIRFAFTASGYTGSTLFTIENSKLQFSIPSVITEHGIVINS